jgi:hypothetical protein
MERALGNVFVRDSLMHGDRFCKAGDVIDGHEHNFDHTTFNVGQSPLLIEAVVRGQPVETLVDPGDYRLIKAGVRHKITAMGDRPRFLCVYPHRTPQSLSSHQGKNAAYDAKLKELIAMADELFGDIVQEYTGWPEAYR